MRPDRRPSGRAVADSVDDVTKYHLHPDSGASFAGPGPTWKFQNAHFVIVADLSGGYPSKIVSCLQFYMRDIRELQ